MQQKLKLVEIAKDICEQCTSQRQEKINLVHIDSWLSCPFKENKGGRDYPPSSCFAVCGPSVCCGYDDNAVCPLIETPLYLNGEVIMLRDVQYKIRRK